MEETASLNSSARLSSAANLNSSAQLNSAASLNSSAQLSSATSLSSAANFDASATDPNVTAAIPGTSASLDPASVPPLPEETASFPSLTPALRILGSLLIFIGSLACLALALLITLGTVLSIPSFLYLGLERPFVSLFSTIGYLVSITCILAIGIFASRLAFSLIRKQEITRKILITCGLTLAMALVCLFLVLPVAAAPVRESIGTPQQYFTNPIAEDLLPTEPQDNQ